MPVRLNQRSTKRNATHGSRGSSCPVSRTLRATHAPPIANPPASGIAKVSRTVSRLLPRRSERIAPAIRARSTKGANANADSLLTNASPVVRASPSADRGRKPFSTTSVPNQAITHPNAAISTSLVTTLLMNSDCGDSAAIIRAISATEGRPGANSRPSL